VGIEEDIGAMAVDIDQWLDKKAPIAYQNSDTAQDWQRISKITEEAGEVVRAFMNLTGANPRRGQSGTLEDVTDEMADVALTAVLAIQHFTKDWSATEGILWNRLVEVWQRMPDRYRTE